MPASHLLGMVSGVAVLCASLYVTFAYLTLPAVPTEAHSSQAAGSGEGNARELAALRQDILRLGAELASLRRQDNGAGTLPSELSRLQSELSRLQNEVHALRQQVQDNTKLTSDDNAGIINTAPESPEARAVVAQQQEQQQFEWMQVINTHFRLEPIDTKWSAVTADLIGQVLGRDEFKQTQIVGMECRSTLCRLEITHPDRDAAGEFELLFPMAISEVLPRG